MKLDFSSENYDRLEKSLSQKPETIEVQISEENPVKSLYKATKALNRKTGWTENTKIKDQEEEKKRFLEAYPEKKFSPSLEFQNYSYNTKTVLKVLKDLEKEVEKIDSETIQKYKPEKLEPEDIRQLFRQNFQEYSLRIKLIETLKDRKKWKKHCLKIWPMLNNRKIQECKSRLEDGFKIEEKEENLTATDLKSMWQDELERLGIEWSIEVRPVNGCFNIPDERTVVVADGEEKKRYYSKDEAENLTIHELFHVARAYNGIKTCEKSSFPPLLGLHTPFYDMTEEGGAVYREKATDVDYPEKEKDYYLRTLAAYRHSQDRNFNEIINELIKLGASPERAFDLFARNRQILRHHIYLGGYWQHWKNQKNLESLLVGKVNPSWAEKIWREVEADGMFGKPPVTSEDLFNYRFKG